ncbi:MAG: hypothetical protein MUO50_19200 [Longimicrobiales bacterium]|nr:hypothetical protein [Longimicrobiales bacterium]
MLSTSIQATTGTCTDATHLFEYKGQTVRESGPIYIPGGPRISVWGGRAFQVGSLTLEPAFGVEVV